MIEATIFEQRIISNHIEDSLCGVVYNSYRIHNELVYLSYDNILVARIYARGGFTKEHKRLLSIYKTI